MCPEKGLVYFNPNALWRMSGTLTDLGTRQTPIPRKPTGTTNTLFKQNWKTYLPDFIMGAKEWTWCTRLWSITRLSAKWLPSAQWFCVSGESF